MCATNRACSTCERKLIGRKDKVYCSIECKNEHHKIARIQTEEIQYSRNKRIKRNLVVLHGIFGLKTKSLKIHKSLLFEYGFDLDTYLELTVVANQTNYRILNYIFSVDENGVVYIFRETPEKVYFKEFLSRWLKSFAEDLFLKVMDCGDGVCRYFERTEFFDESILTVIRLVSLSSRAR